MSAGDTLRAMAEAFNARDWDRARDLLSDDFEFVDLAMGATTHGPDEFVASAQSWASAFPDMSIEVLATVDDERRAAGEFIGRGTHEGTLPSPGGEIPATGRKMQERFSWFVDHSGGKMTAARDYYNAMSIMTQLGLMPEPAEATS
jgi:steroid delta-isomerase-like uncharacterized protein